MSAVSAEGVRRRARVCKTRKRSATHLRVFFIAIGASLAHDFKGRLNGGLRDIQSRAESAAFETTPTSAGLQPREDDLMKKIAHDHHTPPWAPSPFLPVLTLGFYGLRRFRPHWLYVVTALSLLVGWGCLAYFADTIQPGGAYVLAPLVFVMAIVTFFRLLPPTSHRAAAHRAATHRATTHR
jgi:hypothetical protein